MSGKSVPAIKIAEESRRRGHLARQLYIVSTRPIDGIGPIMENLAVHLTFQEELERDGIMFAAGPNWTDDEQTWEGDGTVVLRAGSLEDAKQIAARYPMHMNGARAFTVRPWLINEGRITVQLGLATGGFRMN